MNRIIYISLSTLVLTALQSGLPAPAHGDGTLVPRLALVSEHDPASTLTPVTEPRECKPRYMVGPGMGIPLGLGSFGGGVVMVTVGAFDILEPDPKTRGDRALIAGGSLMMAGGLATFIYSAVKLSKNRQARRRVCDTDKVRERPPYRALEPRRHARDL